MLEWKKSIQGMIDWIEDNIENRNTLLEMSSKIGYSPYYCSYLFHHVTGMTLKSYLAGRRLCYVAIALRDTNERIIDIALKYGYSSQEALTRAFVKAYGCTPNAYRLNPRPIRFSIKQVVLFPEDYINGGHEMSNLKDANIRVEYIPAHKFVGIWEIRADNYGDFWKYHDCDEVCGTLDSMQNIAHPVVGAHTAGWYYENGKKGYRYGYGVAEDYKGEIPKGFSIKSVPAAYYVKFCHPTFDYLTENGEVMQRVEELAWNYDLSSSPNSKRFEWNEQDQPIYQRHYPESFGYEILRPIKKI